MATAAIDTTVPAPDATSAATAAPSTDTTLTSAAPAAVTYDLKLPADLSEGVKGLLDASIVERTTATASKWGLSNDDAQQLLDREVASAKAISEASAKALSDHAKAVADANKPGGTEWVKRESSWSTASKADSEIGGTNYAVSVEHAQQAIARFGTPELKAMLSETGLGSHPEAVRIFARIGKAMAEPTSFVRGTNAPAEKTTAQRMYPSNYNEDGSPKQ